MSELIRITDLAEPVFTRAARDMLEAVDEDMVTLDPDGIMNAASQQTALTDFGSLDFVERLAVICAAYRDDRDLTTMGRLIASTVLIRSAVQRLRHEALWQAHPEIADTDIHRPIIIAGLPRTGTTHLVNLISNDNRLRSLQYWEALEPFPAAGEPWSGDALDPRIRRCEDEFAFRDQIMPYFKHMHEMLPRHIHEEVELQMLDFSGQFIETMGILPRWLAYYQAHDQAPHYAYMKRVLQALQWLRGPDRWIMKSPQHIEQLRPLARTFPDATFVITHRDPVAIMASFCTLVVYTARMGRRPVNVQRIAAYWVDRIEQMLNSCMRDCVELPTENAVHLCFDDFMADEMGTIRRIYAAAGHPLTTAVGESMTAYIREHPRGKHGQIVYDLEGDFGLSSDKLYQRFANYMQHFGIRRELD